MALQYHGPGDRIDQHNLDPNAHAGLFMAAGTVTGPRLIVPPASVIAASAAAVWPTANLAIFNRFSTSVSRSYRYVNLQVGVSSGNIQVGIVSFSPDTATTVNAVKVVDSGIIACPTAGAQRIDLGEVLLPAGDYGLFLWCDNTTAQFMHGIGTGWNASRTTFNATLGTGVGTSVITMGISTRWVAGLTLEASS